MTMTTVIRTPRTTGQNHTALPCPFMLPPYLIRLLPSPGPKTAIAKTTTTTTPTMIGQVQPLNTLPPSYSPGGFQNRYISNRTRTTTSVPTTIHDPAWLT